MYAQSRYQEDLDRLQEEAEYDNNRRREDDTQDKFNQPRERYESTSRDDRYGHADRCGNADRYDSYDRYGHSDRDAYNSSASVSYTETKPYAESKLYSSVKKYRAASYDKHDKSFAKQMQIFAVPQEFNNFTNELLKEAQISQACLLEAIADYNKTENKKPLTDDFQKAAKHCRKYRRSAYTDSDETYAKQMKFYELPAEFNEFTDGLMSETHINRNELLDAIDDYNSKDLPKLPGVFQDVSFNCRPDQPCVIC